MRAYESMRASIRRFQSVVAIFAIALHTLLWAAVAPLIAAPAPDPFSVICHSEAPGPVEQVPSHGPLAPAHACDHCNLCSAIAPPVPNTTRVTHFEPVQLLQVLRPAHIARHDDLTADPKLARGPPAFA
jgi:hypothetical protein